ncbi:probable pectate lyase 4 isoform X1 [Prunus dulcis]|uniref:probable pectate lyase 4 isoform X1 n=1 Tax=Prunus dulcis TaxID=3755 RepID=UPI001482F3C0|nr:probable pectate lyase 4 isoform X1 [Prunus dulcis]
MSDSMKQNRTKLASCLKEVEVPPQNQLANWRWGVAQHLMPFFVPNPSFAKKTKVDGLKLNVIDGCWRWNSDWRRNRQELVLCSVGFSGKMSNNIGRDIVYYQVMDPSDNALDPKPETLRYGATIIRGKKWITFQRDMRIRLEKPLLISSFTAIDGRGPSVRIAGNACLVVFKASNIIIHGLRIHHCRSQAPSLVMGPDGKKMPLGQVDGDAVRLVTASKVWIDHNTHYDCEDGLLDVTCGSTDITVSNNWFRDQDKVMLLGHDDGYFRDKNMRVTVVYNHFGPNCNQRMPRIRYGYAHVVNNLYREWSQYAIGGSMNPSVKSEANLFIAPKSRNNKEITWRKDSIGNKESWKFYSVGDIFENGASFVKTCAGRAKPNNNGEQNFPVVNAKSVRSLTRSSGALKCIKRSRC